METRLAKYVAVSRLTWDLLDTSAVSPRRRSIHNYNTEQSRPWLKVVEIDPPFDLAGVSPENLVDDFRLAHEYEFMVPPIALSLA